MENTKEILKKIRGSQEREEQVKVHRQKLYSCRIKRKIRSLYNKFINKALLNSLPVDVGQVWAKPY